MMNWYKIAQSQNQTRPQIISFDFDGTIANNQWNEEERDYLRDENGNMIATLNENIAQMIHHYHNKNIQIIVVSSRMDKNKDEIIDFIAKYNLPISEVYCTNGQDKIHLLKQLGVSKHFDDDPHELNAIKQDGSLLGIAV